MWKVLSLAVFQSALLALGQVFLKIALQKMRPFGWNWQFWGSLLVNWQFAVCGLLFLAASLLWMYIVKVFPFSMAYPLVSLSYVFGMLAAILIFHEEVPLTRWVGVLLIMAGCILMPADAKAQDAQTARQQMVAATKTANVLGGIGAFGGLFKVPAGRDQVLVASTDPKTTKH